MEALFAVFSSLIVAVRSVSATAADALDYVLMEMQKAWYKQLDVHTRLQEQLDYENEWSRKEHYRAETMRDQRDMLQKQLDVVNHSLLPAAAMWSVDLPNFWVKENFVLVVKMLRDVYEVGENEPLGFKEAIAFRDDILKRGLGLFQDILLSTKEMLAVTRALDWAQDISKTKPNPWINARIHYWGQKGSEPKAPVAVKFPEGSCLAPVGTTFETK